MSNVKTVVVKNLQKPSVIVAGVIVGLILLFSRRGVPSPDQGNQAVALEARKSDNEVAKIQAQVGGAVQQAQINADNAYKIAAAGFNADITSKALDMQTMIALGTEQTKQVLGATAILANRDIVVNQAQMNRDVTLGLDLNDKNYRLGLDTNDKTLQAILDTNRSNVATTMSNNETARYIELQKSNQLVIAGSTSISLAQAQIQAIMAESAGRKKRTPLGTQIGQGLTGLGNAASGIGKLIGSIYGGGLTGG